MSASTTASWIACSRYPRPISSASTCPVLVFRYLTKKSCSRTRPTMHCCCPGISPMNSSRSCAVRATKVSSLFRCLSPDWPKFVRIERLPLPRLLAEARHGVAQRAVDRFAVVAAEALLERAEPCPHGVERRCDRTGRHDAGDADVGARLVGGEQDFVEPLAGPDAGEDDLHVL